jgi:RNA polymerase sigma-70 factor (ECF subfamily)
MNMAKVIPIRPTEREGIPDGRLDAQLVDRCAAGDRAAMGELFDRHGVHVHRFLGRLTGWGTDLDDLVHATFLEAFRAVGRFRGRAQVRTWLFGIAINISRHHLRSEGRRRAFLNVWAERPEERAPRPDQLVERQQLVARVADALADLPYPLRAAYLLCEVEELSGPEAAAALGVRPGTLGRRLHDARKALRAAIDGGPR